MTGAVPRLTGWFAIPSFRYGRFRYFPMEPEHESRVSEAGYYGHRAAFGINSYALGALGH